MAKGVVTSVAQKLVSATAVFVVLSIVSRELDATGYALLSLYISFQFVLAVFDFGISTGASRDFARSSHGHDQRVLLRAYELWISVAAATLFALGVVVFGTIASVPHRPSDLTALLMAGCLALELPIRLYVGVLLAKGRQTTSAGVLLALDLVRWTAMCVLASVGEGVDVLLSVQLGFVVCGLIWIATLSRRLLAPREAGARMTLRLFLELGRLTLAPLAIATLAGVFRLYADRVFASNLLRVDQLGAYVTAFAIAGGFALLSSQVSATLLPRLTVLREADNLEQERKLFLCVNSFVGFVTLTATAVAMVLARPVLDVGFGHDPQREKVILDVFPTALLAALLASVIGPAYMWIVAEGRLRAVAWVNTAGAATVLVAISLRPRSPEEVASIALAPALLVAILIYVLLGRKCGGRLESPDMIVATLPLVVCTGASLTRLVGLW